MPGELATVLRHCARVNSATPRADALLDISWAELDVVVERAYARACGYAAAPSLDTKRELPQSPAPTWSARPAIRRDDYRAPAWLADIVER